MKWRGPFGGGAASGAAGAQVASRAKSTQYIRARTVPVNPRTTFQQAVRNAVKSLTGLWQSLTSDQRASWQAYGATVTVTNTLGDSSKLSGINWFVGNNAPRVQAGFAAVLQGPSIFDRGNPDWSTVAPAAVIATNGTLGTITLTASIAGNNGTNGHLLAYISRPYSPGVTFFNGPYQLTKTITSNSSGNILSGNYTFQSSFPALGVSAAESGNQMQMVLRLDRGDGRLSSKFQLQVDG